MFLLFLLLYMKPVSYTHLYHAVHTASCCYPCHWHRDSLPHREQPTHLGVCLMGLRQAAPSPESVAAAVQHIKVFIPCHLANNCVGGLPSSFRHLSTVPALCYLLAAIALNPEAAQVKWRPQAVKILGPSNSS